MLRSYRALLAVLLVLLSAPLSAQTADFRRVTDVAQVEAGACYVIGAQGVSNYHLLRAELRGTASAPKLSTTPLAAAPGDVLSTGDGLLMWRVEADGADHIVLRNVQSGEAIASKNSKNPGLVALSADKAMSFAVDATEGGFRLASQSVSERYLGLSDWGEDVAKTGFALYAIGGADTEVMHLYRLVETFAQQSGTAVLPADGARLALVADGEAFCADGTLLSTADLLLTNGALAPADALCVLTAEVRTDGNFALRSAEGAWLDSSLSLQAEPYYWRIEGGHVVTAEGAPRYLCYLRAARRFAVLTDAEATNAGAKAVALPCVGDVPSLAVREDNVLFLDGTWPASTLQSVDLSACRALYFGAVEALPAAFRDFDTMPAGRHIPIYLPAALAAVAPENWDLVITYDAFHNCALLRSATLRDGLALYIPEAFTVGEGQLSYERPALNDGGWQTLVLPFAAALPVGIVAEELTEATPAALTFEEVDELESERPYIIYCVSAAAPSLRFTARAGTVSTPCSYAESEAAFFGTFENLRVEQESPQLFFLNGAGSDFVRAAVGSMLPPFRAAIRMEGSATSFALPALTGIASPATPAGPDAPRYTLDGRRITAPAPRGLYIQNGRKLWRTSNR